MTPVLFVSYSGKEADDSRLLTDAEESSLSVVINQPGLYKTVTVELELDALAVNTLLQSSHVNDVEGAAGSVAFDVMPQASLEEMLGGQGNISIKIAYLSSEKVKKFEKVFHCSRLRSM